jgi:hypothetical protein
MNEDAIWIAAEVPDDVARRYEEPDSERLGYRSVVLPGEFVNTLAWRVVPSDEVAAAARAEADAAAAARERARRPG